MRVSWFWWVLAGIPALVGVLSIAVFGVGDFRSSGLVAGMAASLGLVAVLLLLGRPWRSKQGVPRWLSLIPGLALGLVALLGLSEGVPEFLQARGFFVNVDAVGPRTIVSFDDGYVVAGNDDDGGFVWFSDDGLDWLWVEDPSFDELELRDVIVVDSGLVAVGEGADPTEAVVLSSSDGLAWEETGRFGNSEYGTAPWAIGQTDSALVAISDIIGNDVEFYRSADMSFWMAAEPVGVFDDGEGGSDLACNDHQCVGVGFHDAQYRTEVETDTGVVWVSTTDDRYDLVNHNFQADQLTAVVWANTGFLAVGNNTSDQGVAWLSPDGQQWTQLTGTFEEMTIDGVASTDTSYTIFGRNPETGVIMIWTSDTGEHWGQEIVSDDLPEGSQIRSVSFKQNARIAAGIAADTLDTIIWTSTNNEAWHHTSTLETPQTS